MRHFYHMYPIITVALLCFLAYKIKFDTNMEVELLTVLENASQVIFREFNSSKTGGRKDVSRIFTHTISYGKRINNTRQQEKANGHIQLQIPNIKNMTVDQFRDYLLAVRGNRMLDSHFISLQNKVPNMCHFTWLYGTKNHTFNFIHFLSMLSMYNKHRPDNVYLWHESLPVGPFWNKLLQIIRQRKLNLKLMHINSPGNIYGRNYIHGAHKSDIVRLLILQVFGGIYMDLDILIVKSLFPIMNYDFVLGEENKAGLNNGLILSTPDAKFLSLWLDSYKKSYDPKCWPCSSIFAPKKISKIHPETVHVENRSMHHPNWEELNYFYTPNQLYDWSNNYSVHLWIRIWPKQYKVSSIQQIQKQNTTFGEIVRWIWFNTTRIV